MKDIEIKNRLEEKIIFGDDTNPVTCLIYTLDLKQGAGSTVSLQGSDCKKIKVINMDTLIEEDNKNSVELLFTEVDRFYTVSFRKSKMINIKTKYSNNLKIEASLKVFTKISDSEIETKSINCNDILENINENIKVCVLYVHSASVPIIKIKSLDQFNKDLESFEYGFDITNLSEENLIYNSHYSRVTIEEKKIKTTKDIPMFNIDSMSSQIKDNIINEEFIRDKDGNIIMYINHDTGISAYKEDNFEKVYLNDILIYPLDDCFGNIINSKTISENIFENNKIELVENKYDSGYSTIIQIINQSPKYAYCFYKNKLFMIIDFFERGSICYIYNFIEYDVLSDLSSKSNKFELLTGSLANPFIISKVFGNEISFKLNSNSKNKNEANEFINSLYFNAGLEIYYSDNLSYFSINNRSDIEKSSPKFRSAIFKPEEVFIRNRFGIPVKSFKELLEDNKGE